MTQRGSFVFALPFPVVRDNAPPMSDARDEAFNTLAAEWRRARWTMSERVEVWQQTFRECADDSLAPDDAEHYFMELLGIYDEHVLPVQRQWAALFTHAAGRGSAMLYRNEFVPEWFVSKHALYAMKTTRKANDVDDAAATHRGQQQQRIGARFSVFQCSSPAWVFESVCMKYLQYACLQVLAYLRGVDNDVDEAMRYSTLAVAANAELLEHTLPLYFASPSERSSFLLARHFHESYLAAHLQAQNDQIASIKCTNSETILSALCGALLLLRACKLLTDASTTFYDDLPDNYRKVIAHSRCCAHFLLALAFWLAYKQDVAITLADSSTPLFVIDADVASSSSSSIDNRCLAMNAFYCIRSALVQTPVVPSAMSTFYNEVALDLANNYCIGTPPHPLTGGNASESDSIVIHGRIGDDDDDAAHTATAAAQVRIMHAYTPYIDIGQDKRFTVSMRSIDSE